MHLPLKQEHGGQRFGPKNHRLYRIATSPEDLPNDVVEWIRATTEDARYMFARIPWTEGATELFQALRPYMRRLKSRAQGSMPTAKLLQAIFFNTLSRLPQAEAGSPGSPWMPSATLTSGRTGWPRCPAPTP